MSMRSVTDTSSLTLNHQHLLDRVVVPLLAGREPADADLRHHLLRVAGEMRGVVVAPEAELLVLLETLAQRHAGRDRRSPSAPRRGRPRPAGCRAGTPCRPRPGRSAPCWPSSTSSPQPPISTKPLLCSSTAVRARRGPGGSCRRRTRPCSARPRASSLSQIERVVEGALAVAEGDEGGDGRLPVLAEIPDRLRARVRRPVLRLAPPLERAQHVEARDLLLGVGFQMGGVVDPAEAGLPVGGEYGRAGLGDRVGVGQARQRAQGRHRQNARKQGESA